MSGEITWEQIAMITALGGAVIGALWKFVNTRKADLDSIYTRIEADVSELQRAIKESSDQNHARTNDTNRALSDLRYQFGKLEGRTDMLEKIILKKIEVKKE